MEWIVPILFVLVSLFQWWAKRRESMAPAQPQDTRTQNPPPTGDPLDEFGDLLEALGRRRHESPPPPSPLAKAPPPRILPPIASPVATTPLPPASIPVPPLPARVLPSTSKNWDRLSPSRRWIRGSHQWPEAIILSEILAPPVALR